MMHEFSTTVSAIDSISSRSRANHQHMLIESMGRARLPETSRDPLLLFLDFQRKLQESFGMIVVLLSYQQNILLLITQFGRTYAEKNFVCGSTYWDNRTTYCVLQKRVAVIDGLASSTRGITWSCVFGKINRVKIQSPIDLEHRIRIQLRLESQNKPSNGQSSATVSLSDAVCILPISGQRSSLVVAQTEN